jgi:peptide/nickel transport system substrate-binding protein
LLKTLPGYDPDVRKNRTDARHIMEKLGYGPETRLKVKVSVRDLPFFRDPGGPDPDQRIRFPPAGSLSLR